VLEEYTEKIRTKDLVGISMFGGMSCLSMVLGVFFLMTASSDGKSNIVY
jgi:hypothetical protein